MARRLEEIDGSKQDYEQSLQQLVNQSPWPAGLVRDRLQRWVAASSAAQVRRHLGGSAAGNDRKRMTRAGVPDDVGYEPKWKMALTMLERAKANGLKGVVLADALYGSVTEFRRSLEKQGWTYCVGVESTLSVIDAAEDLGEVPSWLGKGRPPTRPSRVAAKVAGVSVKPWAVDHAADFRTVNWREGSKVRKGKVRQAVWPFRRLAGPPGPPSQ